MAFQPLADHSRRPPWMSDASAPSAIPFSRAERMHPSHPATTEGDVIVPLGQSLITGILVGVPVSTLITLLTNWPWWTILVGSICTVSIAWSLLLVDHRKLLRVTETIIGRDLDGDKQIGPPAPIPSVHIEVDTTPGGRMAMEDLPVPGKRGIEGLVSFCRSLGDNGSFSERAANEHGYTRLEWQGFRDKLINHEFAMWDNPNRHEDGVTLLAIGRRVCRQTAKQLESLH